LSGTQLSEAEALSADHWGRREPRDTAPGLAHEAIFDLPETVLLEAGAGGEAAKLLVERAVSDRRTVVRSLESDGETGESVSARLWRARGRLWLAGASFDWRKCHHEKRFHVSLPGYPFERQRCWIGPPDSSRVMPRPGAPATMTGEQVRHPRPDLSTPWRAPETEIERKLAGLWEELLGIESVGTADNFFDLGGHSLIAVQLVSRLREIFDIAIEPEAVFEAADITELAQAVEKILAEQGGEMSMSEEEAEALLRDSAEQ
jgi:acyl transferase domain-containing protein